MQIEPVESILAVTGVQPILTKKVERFTKAHVEDAERLPRTIERLARQLCKDDLIDVSLSGFDYDDVLQDLYEEWNPDQVEAMVRSLSKYVADLDVAFLAKAADVVKYLQNIFPRSAYTTFLGAANVVPNDVAIYQFQSILEVLDNPLRVFTLMANGSISKRQVASVRLVYPTLSAAIDEVLVDVAAGMKADKASYELPPTAEIGVTRWFGQPAISPTMAAQLQAVAPKPKEPSSPVPAAKAPKSSTLAKESLSSAQRATYAALK